MGTEIKNVDPRSVDAINLPDPTGHYLLVALPNMERVTAGGVLLLDDTVDNERAASVFGTVLAMGPDAYQDERRFPSGPRCTVGDTIMFTRYQGVRFKVEGVEYRLLSDDLVLATVSEEAAKKLTGL